MLVACHPLSQRSGPAADEYVGQWAPVPAAAGTWAEWVSLILNGCSCSPYSHEMSTSTVIKAEQNSAVSHSDTLNYLLVYSLMHLFPLPMKS